MSFKKVKDTSEPKDSQVKAKEIIKKLLSKDEKVYTKVFLNSKCCCDC